MLHCSLLSFAGMHADRYLWFVHVAAAKHWITSAVFFKKTDISSPVRSAQNGTMTLAEQDPLVTQIRQCNVEEQEQCCSTLGAQCR